MDYNGFVLSLATFMGEQDQNNNDFQNIIPNIIDYAEGRMYRDLDMIGAKFTDTAPATANNRFFTLPTETLIIDIINVVDSNNNRSPLVPVSREFLDWTYPNVTGAALPTYFAVANDTSIILGPWPDQAYTIEVRGVQRPAPLGSGTPMITSTILTKYLPETFLTCAMIYAVAYQKNFGAQIQDPSQAVSWEAQYVSLMKSATVWELRKKFESDGWTSDAPNPMNPRGN
jgi:hypothetical protein